MKWIQCLADRFKPAPTVAQSIDEGFVQVKSRPASIFLGSGDMVDIPLSDGGGFRLHGVGDGRFVILVRASEEKPPKR